MKKILILLGFLLEFICVSGQETATKSIYFPSDGYKLSRKQKNELNAFLDSAFRAGNVAEIIKIAGHTDSAAGINYNIILSQKRCATVQKFIKAKGVNYSKTEVKGYGENNPLYHYSNGAAMAKNRRVDVEIVFNSTKNNNEKIASETSILDLYKLLETAADTFLVDNNFDTILRSKNGVIVSIPANTICERLVKLEKVKVAIKDVINIPEMISQNASTGSGGNLLLTGGMVQINAFTLQNNPLQICESKSFTILMPTKEPDEEMQLFYASRDENFGLDWELENPEEKLDIISGSIFKNCYYPAGNSSGTGGGSKCRLFFCKIRYAIKNIRRKIFTRKSKVEVVNYKKYQMRGTLNALAEKCEDKKKKLEEIDEKFNGINTGKLQEITAEDANYYIFNTSRIGWINCDRYLQLPPAQLTNVKLPVKSVSTTDFKLILSEDIGIMPSYDLDGKVGFPNVPKGKKAKILGLSFANGQPAMAVKEIIIGEEESDLNLEFNDLNLAELKKIISDL